MSRLAHDGVIVVGAGLAGLCAALAAAPRKVLLVTEAALNHLRFRGEDVKPEDVARLSPLEYQHINFLGRYSFALTESIASGELRSLRESDEESPP